MKLFSRSMILLLGIILLASGLTATDPLQEIGLSAEEAANLAFEALVQQTIPFGPVSEAFKAAAPGERMEMVRAAAAWMKAYAKTPGFAETYKQWREDSAPTPPASTSASAEMARQKAEFNKMVEETKKSIQSMPAEMRKELEKSLDAAIAQQKALEKDQKFQAALSQGLQQEQKQRQEEYTRKSHEFEAKYPADPKKLIALRLRSFLDLIATIDFAAKLFDRDGLKIFADEKYETKPGEWKLCFRAGKAVVQEARAAAVSWLAEIEKR